MNGFRLYPAIDVREGRVVRLRQGDYAQETRYGGLAVQYAIRYADAGAGWLHLVDLDAARAGGYSLLDLVRIIRNETPLRIQTGGGVRTADDIARMLEAGAARVVVGSLAVRQPELVSVWLERFGSERITVALDTRRVGDRWRLPTAGWTSDSAADLDALVDFYVQAGLRHVLCTDISCDGMLAGPGLVLYRQLTSRAPSLSVQASGGVRDVADIAAVRAAGCAGAVLGKALLEERFHLGDALREEAPC